MYQNLWPDELKILVVDLDQESLNLIRLSLELAGFRVIRTYKPEEGLLLARREKPDLLILDIPKPGSDGFELLRQIRQNPELELIPIIAVSTRAQTIDQQRMLQLFVPDREEIEAYVGKPVNPVLLLKAVKRVLVNHKEYLLQRNKRTEKPWERMVV